MKSQRKISGSRTYLLPGRVPALIDAGVGHPDHLALSRLRSVEPRVW